MIKQMIYFEPGMVAQIYNPIPVLRPPGENNTTTTLFEPNLKQVLFSTSQDNGHWPDSYPIHKKMAPLH